MTISRPRSYGAALVITTIAATLPACATTERHSGLLVVSPPTGDEVTIVLHDAVSGAVYELPARASTQLGATWETTSGVRIDDREVVEVRVVDHRHGLGAVQGLGAGVLTGAAFGAILGYASGDDPPCEFICLSLTAGEKATLAGVMYGAGGAVLGGIIGAAIGSKTTHVYGGPAARVPAPAVRVVPTADGATASATWRF